MDRKTRWFPIWLMWMSLAWAVRGTGDELTRFEFASAHMGTDARLVFYAENERVAKLASAEVFASFERLEQIFSDYRADSEIRRLTRAFQQPVPVSDDLLRVLESAQALAAESDGAFDVTVGPLSRLWRRARRQGRLPDQPQLEAALTRVDYRHLQLDPETQQVTLAHADMRLDLGGIAKGDALDVALQVLRQHGIDRGLVELGGDVAISGPPPDQSGWTVGVRPLKGMTDGPVLLLSGCAVATSGAAYQVLGSGRSAILTPD